MKSLNFLRFIFMFSVVQIHAQTNVLDSLAHQNYQRKFMVHLPPQYNPNGAYPLVISLHGGSGNMMNAQGFSMLNPVADENNFITAWPQGFGIAPPGFSWADGRNTSADQAGIDDVGFIHVLFDTLSSRYGIDTTRVYLCGFSNGGFMVQRMACESPERFAAMASLGSSMDTMRIQSCSPQKAVPMAFFNGTTDPAMPFTGGPMENPQVIPVVPVDSTVQFWVKHNNCQTTEPVYFFPDIFPGDSSTAELYEFTNCSCNANVKFYKLINGGHTWPGVFVASQAAVLGNTNRDINASEELWGFFSNYSLCEIPLRNHEQLKDVDFVIYPNPSGDELNLRTGGINQFKIKIMTLRGEQVFESDNQHTIDISHLNNGIYIITIKTEKQIFTKRFVKINER